MDFEIFLVLLNIVSFLVCFFLFILKFKTKRYLGTIRSVTIITIFIIAVFILYTLFFNYIFQLEITSAALVFTGYILSFCLLDIILLLQHNSFMNNYKPNLKTKRPFFWKKLYQLFTYFYISIRGLYFIVLFILSFYVAAPIIGMFYFGQYTLDNVINSDRHGKALGLGFCRYATYVLDNRLYIESLENENMISISKVYFGGLFKKRVFFIKQENVNLKESGQKDVVLLREYNSTSSFTLKIENFKEYYKLDCIESGRDTIQYIIAK